MNWYAKNSDEVCERMGVNGREGLSFDQADERLKVYGTNKLKEKKRTSIFLRFFAQLNDFMIIILLSAAGVSFAVSMMSGDKDFIDPIIILIIVALNAILGMAQESKAERALEALKKITAPTAKVIREGRHVQIAAENIVPGDIVLLEAGDLIPADARLIACASLMTEEAALTGESLPVEKDAELIVNDDAGIGDRRNMVFTGSSVSGGRGKAVVVTTGMNTEVGKIAAMLISDEQPETPLQKKLAETGKMLGIGALCICAGLFIIGLFRKIDAFEMFMTSVSLAVAAIPEGLPAIVTIMLAIGVQRMAKRNAVIRKLPAVETLGSATVICSDKTGTLTQNRMKVVEISNGNHAITSKSEQCSFIMSLTSLCNDSVIEESGGEHEIKGDPTEKAFVAYALNCGIHKAELEKKLPRVSEVPFDSKRKLMTTIHKKAKGYPFYGTTENYISVTKGAADVLIEKCTMLYIDGKVSTMTPAIRRGILEQNSKMADKALRVLGAAYKEISVLPLKMDAAQMEQDLVFVGLVGIIDPPREEVAGAVETCVRAGIKPVMVTGDHVATAVAIAKKVGIMQHGGKAMTGAELSKTSQEELSRKIFEYSVFARVSPEHKVRIVKAFQSAGAVVAMTGDGVNDAPALQAADIGCAMGISGTDVAKGVADMVLTDDNFATIVDAVREGRGIYQNIRKSVHFLLSSNIGEILTIFVAIVMGWRTPLLAIQLLWVNLVTDSLPAIALGLDPADEGIMRKKPFDNHKSLFTGGLWQQIILEGLMIGMLALLAFLIGSSYGYLTGRAMAFATLSISQLVHAFNMRSEKSIFTVDLLSNPYLIAAFGVGAALQAAVIQIAPIAKIFKVTPLNSFQWLIVVFLCVMPIAIVELEKLWNGREEIFSGASFKSVKL